MEDKNQMEEMPGGEKMQDTELEQASGGASASYTGEFYLELSGLANMNNLWDAMYIYGAYGKAVKEVVDKYCTVAKLQQLSGFRYKSTKKICVYAKDSSITVNGVHLSL
ncbi:MAG: hypothetical protein LUD18_07500 [Lachnospiraceae bacterium]|nr:hypothetical protein [Lachnospiraceae bacterium]